MLKLFGGARAKRRELSEAYGRQRAELDAAHASDGTDVFVSPYDIVRDSSGNELSYATWPEGMPTWLPKADSIAFTGQRGDARWFFIVRWEDVEAACPGVLMPIPELTPARFRTVSWPSSAQLEKLSVSAVIRK